MKLITSEKQGFAFNSALQADFVTVEMNIQIYNLSGKKIFEQFYIQKPLELDVSPLSSGVFLFDERKYDKG